MKMMKNEEKSIFLKKFSIMSISERLISDTTFHSLHFHIFEISRSNELVAAKGKQVY